MTTILRVDTPKKLRDLDATLEKPAVVGRIAFSLVLAAAAPVGLFFAIIAGDWIGIAVAVGWFALWTGWIFRIWHRLKAARPYRVPVRYGVDLIKTAHDTYRRLTPASAETAHALVKTLYRLSVVDVAGETGEARVRAEMQVRVDLLQNLLAAEDAVQVATAQHSLDDQDDVAGVKAWREALAEVEAKLAVGDLAP